MKENHKAIEAILSILCGNITKGKLQELDWGAWIRFLENVRYRNLGPLIFYNLKKKGLFEFVPSDLRKDLEFDYITNTKQNMLASRELATILTHTNEAGIRIIVLKGLSLANTIYPNIALRPMFDIDALIRKDDLVALKEILKEKLGYQVSNPDFASGHERFGNEITFEKEGYFPFEVRWKLNQFERFATAFKIDEDKIWEEGVPADIEGIKTLFLSREYMFFYLCYHLSLAHRFCGIIWLYDIKALIENSKDQFNWDKFLRIATEAKAKTLVYRTLVISKNILNVSVSRDILRQLSPSRIKRFVLERIINEGDVLALSDKQNKNKYYVAQIFLIDRLKDILGVLIRIIFPSRDWLAYRYSIKSDRMFWIYRFAHPLVIMLMALKSLIRNGRASP